MAKNKQHGFSLVELMVVVVIIGVFSAMTIPGITEVIYRNSLIEVVDEVQQAAAQTRALAMQTRQAAVLEVRPTMVWVNLLQGALCEDLVIERRCLTPALTGGDGSISLLPGSADHAGAAMCGGFARTLDDSNQCKGETSLSRDPGFALCYSGRGELFVRVGADNGTACSQNPAAPAPAQTWLQACGDPVQQEPFGNLKMYEGAVIIFNRYGSTALCSGTVHGIRRAVYLPITGAPYSKLAPEAAP